jgi:predicted Zn finger-like uncharacterized protein
MKVSCQSCGAQYNLPDDKVRGRKAKVRCKKCSAQIIVDGTSFADEEDDEATRVMMSPALSASGEPVWTVNLSDEEQLDMTEPEVLAGWRDGRVTEDAYVWREGMDEWLPIMESALAPAIRALGAKAPDVETPAPVVAAPVVAAPVTREVASAPKVGSSPLAAPAPKVASAPLASPAPPVVAQAPASLDGPNPSAPKPKSTRSDDTSKAFSFALSGSGSSATKKASRPPGAAAAAVGGLFGSPAPAPAPAASSASSAASSENSVMFSLDALKAAAAVEPKRSSVRAAAVSDARVNEDVLTLGAPSRFDDHVMPLIDIEVPPPAPRFDAPVAASPLAAPQKKKSSWGLIVVGLLAVAGMAGAYILGQQGKDQPPPVAANDTTDTVAGTRQASTAEQANTAAATGEQPAASATAAPVASNAPNAATQVGGNKPVGGGGTGGGKPVGDKTPEKPTGETGKTPDKPAPSPGPAPAAKPAGPAFNVAAAKSALASAAGGAAGCRAPAGPTGSGKVQVTFAPSGNVTSALIVSGPFGGTPVGSCVARTFRAAKVPAFDGSPMTVSKSFTIN